MADKKALQHITSYYNNVPIVAIPYLVFERKKVEGTYPSMPFSPQYATVLFESFHQVVSLARGRDAAIHPNVSATADPAQNEAN